VVLDGGMGTLLQDLGLDDGGSGELWNVDRPDAIRDAHRSYAEAGAQILTTNTFGGTRPRLDMHALGDRVHELNEAAARLAREVADEHGILVAGDLGPTGELMAPLGTMDAAEAQAIFEEQLAGLRDGGIDVVLIETMSDLAEVEAAVAAARAVVPDLRSSPRSASTPTSHDDGRAPRGRGGGAGGRRGRRRGRQLWSRSAGDVADRRGAGRRAPEGLLLAAQSNAGLPQVVGDHFEYDATPADMAVHAEDLRALGIDLIGACCGSTPEHTAAISRAIA
jgi:5-methyltetrahydrofolate--homocysteine methyltransferase